MADEFVIKTTQFKRGLKATLERRLVASDLGVLAAGEPAFELDTGQMKVGNGISSYLDLPYVGKAAADDPRFVIHDPVANQILVYDATEEKWVNKDLTNNESIVYLASRGLTLKGYDAARQGQMLVKDSRNGIAWVNPVSDAQLQAAVAIAERHATEAGNAVVRANEAVQEAEAQAGIAQRINDKTIEYVNNKFWWGTAEEYNALPKIDAGVFYFVRAED